MKSCNNTTSLVLRKGAWTPEEDMLLKDCIQKFGEGKWHLVPQRAGLNRCRKSCRLRWLNYLKPSIKRGHFEEDEVDLLRRLHKLLGNRWSLIAGRLPGRTANDVKNYWNRCRPKQKKEELKDGEPVVTIVKPIPCTLSKSLNLQLTYNENRNLITSSNGGIGNASVSDDRINEYLTDDHEKEADVEVGWSFPDDEGLRINVDQEDGQISLFDFSIEEVDIWDLIT